jgi:hypothetical protein
VRVLGHLTLLKELYTLTALALASIWDIRRREVDILVWYLSIKIILPVTLYEVLLLKNLGYFYYIKVSLVIDVLILLLYLVLYLFDLIGGSDVWALALITVSLPYLYLNTFKMYIPVTLITAFLASFFQLLFYGIYVCINNLKSPVGYRGLKCLIKLRTKAEDLLKRRWWFLTQGESLGKFSIEEWPYERLALIIGTKGKEAEVEATPGIPHIPFLTLGYILTLVITKIAS